MLLIKNRDFKQFIFCYNVIFLLKLILQYCNLFSEKKGNSICNKRLSN